MPKKQEDFDLSIESNNEPVMYIIVNSDLLKKMNKGKVGAQCCHSVCEVIWYLEKYPDPIYLDWKKNSQAKIVKKATEEEMLNIISNCRERTNTLSATGTPFWCAHIRDEGRTQIDKNSLTTLSFCPIPKKHTPKWLADFKLL